MMVNSMSVLVATCFIGVVAMMGKGMNVEAFSSSLSFCRNNAVFTSSLLMAKGGKKPKASDDSYLRDMDFEVDEVMQTLLDETEVRMKKDADHWRAIKLLSLEEAAATLDEEWLGAYTRYHAQMKEDIDSMVEIATLVAKLSETNRLMPKTKGQRKRDAWSRKLARLNPKAAVIETAVIA